MNPVCINLFDSGFGVGIVSDNGHLTAGIRAGRTAALVQGHTEQADGDLLPVERITSISLGVG